jgi:alpha-L-fucosidase
MPENTDYTVEDTGSAVLEADPKAVERFRNCRTALTAHFGLYALSTHGNEWIYFADKIPYNEYKKRMDYFELKKFNADEWADLLLETGMSFFMITAKHHDGFCLWDSRYTDFKITNTAFGRDLISELADALHKRNLGLHFYYSLVDWTCPAYRADWPSYVQYYQNQLKELCSNYGKIDGVLFDGYWPKAQFNDAQKKEYFEPRGKWDLAGTYDLIHTLQPEAVITNNTHVLPLKGEDYQVWELDIPGENTFEANCTEIGEKPTASWWNVNSAWGYQPWNHNVKTADELFSFYQRCQTQQATLFLNVGPRAFGDIHPEEQNVLRQFGKKLKQQKNS